MVSRNSISILAPGLALFALVACDHGVNGPTQLSGTADFVGDYTVSGDRIFMTQPPDTSWSCDAGVAIPEVEPAETDTTSYTLVGTALTLWSDPDTLLDDEGGFIAVLRSGSLLRRSGVGMGLEGRWRMESFEFHVLSGALDEEHRKMYDRFKTVLTQRNQYITSELEFAGGKAWSRVEGRFADFFVDDWNGRIAPDSTPPDSALYDIEVRTVDARTVSLKGRKSGENVTLTFDQPMGFATYSSDNPAHKTYNDLGYRPDCSGTGLPRSWFFQFKRENAKQPILFKKGPGQPENGRFRGILDLNHRFFRGIQGSPLNRP